jgi:hypothetical protein
VTYRYFVSFFGIHPQRGPQFQNAELHQERPLSGKEGPGGVAELEALITQQWGYSGVAVMHFQLFPDDPGRGVLVNPASDAHSAPARALSALAGPELPATRGGR